MLGPFEKLKRSLSKTKDNLLGKISRVVMRRKIDDDLLDDIEEILIEADVGGNLSQHQFMLWKTPSMHEHNRDSAYALIMDHLQLSARYVRIQALQHVAIRTDAGINFNDRLIQLIWTLNIQRKDIGSVLVSDA